jgi:GDPmannose 4,6-dehydratase
MPKALISGVTGQDGAYLAEFLLAKGYEVHGLTRKGVVAETSVGRRDPRIEYHQGDLGDSATLIEVMRRVRPDEIYNLGAQTHVPLSFEQPEYTAQISGVGCLRLLEAARAEGGPEVRFCQAASSEIYGRTGAASHDEGSPVCPQNPYASAKAFAFFLTRNYREAFGLFAANAILFNHESPRRDEKFVTRKITRAAARIKLGLQSELVLGNLDARRDWGHARDYVEAMWLILQAPVARDYVIATGQARSIRDFLTEAFGYLELEWQDFVRQDPQFMRKSEIDVATGNAGLARDELGWSPKTSFQDLVREMVEHDLELARAELSGSTTS